MTFSVISHFPHLLLPKDTEISYLAVASSAEKAAEISARNPGTIVVKVTEYTYSVQTPVTPGDAVIDHSHAEVTADTPPRRGQMRRGPHAVDRRLANARVIA